MKPMRVGVVGATGIVGECFLDILEKNQFPVEEVRLFAGPQSVGQTRKVNGKTLTVQGLQNSCFDNLDFVFFSAGTDISERWAPEAVKAGAYAIDNSSAFRMDQNTPLVVPEVNADEIDFNRSQIIANPNCSTIQLVVALKPLQDLFGISRVRVATYQAVSGAGREGRQELLDQVNLDISAKVKTQIFPQAIAYNCIPQIGDFDDDGFCVEETKIMAETKKILNLPELKISTWTVRVPALNGHSEVAWVTLQQNANQQQIIHCLQEAQGLVINEGHHYTTARQSSGLDPVYVGRVHADPAEDNTWMLWIVADNVRKGAALNGFQIAQKIFDKKSGERSA